MFLNRMNATIHKVHSVVKVQDCVVFHIDVKIDRCPDGKDVPLVFQLSKCH